MPTTAEILLRDHVRYSGDGKPDEPVGMPAPVGDPESGIHNPTKRDFRVAIDSVTGSADAAREAADRANEAADRLLSFRGRLQFQISRMKAGERVTIACYGDSTTDGNRTTGWTANPTNESGAAIGNAAHSPANAWPAVLQELLRDMFRNPSLTVWNAGYGGKGILSGWALANIDRAIINNPAYGTPDICILGFGLNDIVLAGFSPAAYRTALINLILAINDRGMLPVILTPDPVAENTARQGGSISELVAVQREVAEIYGIDVINTRDAVEKVFSAGGTNSLWAFDQGDDLHFGDQGHRVKGAFVAATLFPNTLFVEGTDPVNVAAWSRHSNTDGLSYTIYDEANNRFGGSMNLAAGSYSTGQALIDVWCWIDNPMMEAFWRSVSGDGYYNPSPLATAPTIEAKSYISGGTLVTISSAAGATQQVPNGRDSEMPVLCARPPAGLTRLTFKAPTDNSARPLFLGYFCLRKSNLSSAISYTGFWGVGGSGRNVFDADGLEANSPLVGGGFTRSFNMVVDVAMPNGAGVFIYSGRVFTDGTGGVPRRSRGVVLQRSGANAVLLDVTYDSGGVISVATIGSAAYAWSDTGNEFNIRAGAGNGTQYVLQVTPSTDPLTPLISVTRERSVAPWPAGGKLGALYKDYGVSTNAGRVRFEVFGISQV